MQTLTRADLVVSIPSDEQHEPLIRASYLWRKVRLPNLCFNFLSLNPSPSFPETWSVPLSCTLQGLRTVVAVNDTELAEAFNQVADAWQEKWVYWPGSNLDPQVAPPPPLNEA